MKNLFQRILLIHSIVLTNIILFVGGSSHLDIKQNNTQYTLKNLSEDLENVLLEEKQINQSNNFNYLLINQNHFNFIFFVTLVFFFYFRQINLKLFQTYNIQPKIHSSTL